MTMDGLRKVATVDFDGVIVENRYPGIGPLKLLAKEGMTLLQQRGFYVIVWTCRTGSYLEEAESYLRDHCVLFHTINKNEPGRVEHFGGDSAKISADLHIDDCNLGGFPGWAHVITMLAGDEIRYSPEKLVLDMGDLYAHRMAVVLSKGTHYCAGHPDILHSYRAGGIVGMYGRLAEKANRLIAVVKSCKYDPAELEEIITDIANIGEYTLLALRGGTGIFEAAWGEEQWHRKSKRRLRT